jgi:hypothetical protein
MSGQITIVVSIAALFISLGAAVIALRTVTGLGSRYSEFVESHITTLRVETKKQNSDSVKKMKELTAMLEKGGDGKRDERDQLTEMEARIAQLATAVKRLEGSGAKSLSN